MSTWSGLPGAGPTPTGGQVIPADRTHAPITFDTMALGSPNALTARFRTGRPVGAASGAADQWRGQGAQFNAAARSLSTATGVLGARADDIDAIVDNLTKMMAAFNERQVSLTQLVDDLGARRPGPIRTRGHHQPVNDLKPCWTRSTGGYPTR